MVIGIVAVLLLTGWMVKHHRAAHFTSTKPVEIVPATSGQPAKP
jgi:hypothetical protein